MVHSFRRMGFARGYAGPSPRECCFGHRGRSQIRRTIFPSEPAVARGGWRVDRVEEVGDRWRERGGIREWIGELGDTREGRCET